MNHNQGIGQVTSWALGSCLCGALLFASCGGSGSGSSSESTGSSYSMVRVSNGFAELLPHKTYRIETVAAGGEPQIMAIRSLEDLFDNVTTQNPVQPIPVYPDEAVLPSGVPGNHFMYAQFSSPLDVDSILSDSPGLLESNSFTGAIIVSSIDPQTGESIPVRGQVLINGKTYGDVASGSPALLPYQEWITPSGEVVGFDTNDDGTDDYFPGIGFPGTEGSFSGQANLLSPNTVVFVVDSDSDLSTHETFPTGLEIRMQIQTSVLDQTGRQLGNSAMACTTVGTDTISPEVISSPPPVSSPAIIPGSGEQDVDPTTTISIEFSEPVQPWTVGSLLSDNVPGLSSAISIVFGPNNAQVDLPFHVVPVSPYDLSTWELIPIFSFPGSGPSFAECGIYNRVDIFVRSGPIGDLAGNFNTLPASTFFVTGEGPGMVNVPVTPDAIYLGRSGGTPGLSVIDLNAFGQGTGNPTYDPANPIVEGNSNYPNNPNVKIQGTAMRPPLSAGTCTIDGGSRGVFTLAVDSSLEDLVVRTPVLQSVGDMMLGYSLDVTFNNAPAPFGCQGSSGGNLCAADGFKQVASVIDGSTLSPAASNPNGVQVLIDGGPNIVSWSPHPNPPPLVYPPLCISPFIGGQEPTSVDTPATNLLVPGNPFGDPALGVPPNGLLASITNVYFQGPSLPATNVNACTTYGLRQQIGQFLYVVDRARNEILVLNSNRMTVIDRILVPDPTSLAIGTNLDLLAVSSQTTDSVTFIDINPNSAAFHTVVKTVSVGSSPRGLAWEPGNEDILVCNEGDSSVSIISAFSLAVRKVIISNLNQPFEVAITPRQAGFGLQRNVYFAYIIGRNGKVSVFESGPNSVNGWGYDDVIGTLVFEFLNPKTIKVDPIDINSAFWVVHEGPLDPATNELAGPATQGAVTNVFAESAIFGQLPLNVSSLLIPQFRDINYAIRTSLGEGRLTGVPVDIAFDNQINLGGLVNWATNFSAGSPVPLNGKAIVRAGGPSSSPRFLFAAVPNPTIGLGGVDVLLLDGAYTRYDTNAFLPGIQSIPALGTVTVMDYFRQ